MPTRARLAAIALVAAITDPRAQEPAAAAGPQATLQPMAAWVWQCEPLRCALRAVAPDGSVMVRSRYAREVDPLAPLQVERRTADGEHWERVQAPPRRLDHPASHLTVPRGLQLDRQQDFLFEFELWDLAVMSRPGAHRLRFLLHTRDAASKDGPWSELATPWVEFEIRAHDGNAAFLLGDDAAERGSALDLMSFSLNSTQTMVRNQGPTNPGPSRARGGSWQRHVPLAERLVADTRVSSRLRARARLVLAYDAIAHALDTTGAQRDAFVLAARTHLGATEVIASPPAGGLDELPSGGLAALRWMLLAGVDGLDGKVDPRDAHRQLAERHPFFAMWWRHEAADLLLR